METLLSKFKKSIGGFTSDATMDAYYQQFLDLARADLLSDDISDTVLNGDIGVSCVILYAEALMNKADIATNPTISLLRNKLANMTKGERVIV